MTSKHKKKTRNLIIIIAAILIIAAIFVVSNFLDNDEIIEEAGSSDTAKRQITEIVYDGKHASLRDRTTSFLVIGLDDFAEKEEEGLDDIVPFYNFVQADFMGLVVLDDENETVSLLPINRDTMCDVRWLDVLGNEGGWVYEQIALAHTYGSGGKDSCENVVKTVESFLLNAPIDDYIAFTMDSVGVINDMVGGVTVTVEDDLSSIDPELKEGTTITLKGDQALKFVRARREVKEDPTNINRMARQKQYLYSFFKQAKIALDKDSSLALDVFDKTSSYITTTMTAESLSHAVDKLSKYEILPMYSIEGEVSYENEFAEFYPDIDNVFKNIKEMFCK